MCSHSSAAADASLGLISLCARCFSCLLCLHGHTCFGARNLLDLKGAPLMNVVVTRFDPSGASAETRIDEDGRFELNGVKELHRLHLDRPAAAASRVGAFETRRGGWAFRKDLRHDFRRYSVGSEMTRRNAALASRQEQNEFLSCQTGRNLQRFSRGHTWTNRSPLYVGQRFRFSERKLH